VGELWRGISSEVTDATGSAIDGFDHLFRGNPLFVPNPFSVRPVLAEKTVKRTSMIENGKILKAVFWTRAIRIGWISRTRSPRTDPIGHAVGGESIVVPTGVS
jgi:hypothetical protein